MTEIDQVDLPSSSSSSPEQREFHGGKSAKTLRKSGKPYQFVPSACQICMGKATGHHYDVASCNGCKSFFRRVTIEKLKYQCQAANRCYDDIQPGDPVPKCRSCRYKRCVNAGMNPLGIQSELRKHSEASNADDCKEIVILPKIIEPPKSLEAQVSDLIQHLVRLDLKTASFRDCTYNPIDFPRLKDAVKDEISILGLGDRMGPMPGWPLSPEVIAEVKKPSPVPGTRRVLPANVKRWMMYDLLTVVEMAKTFDFFRKLSETDRYLLCRDTIYMVSNLTRAFFCVERKTDELVRPDGQLMPAPPSWFPRDYDWSHGREVSRRALGSLLRLKCSKIEFLLLRAILLCNSAAPDISSEARGVLSAERSKYTIALLNYLMANDGADGPARFAHILNIIDVLERQQKDQRDMHVLFTLYRPIKCPLPLLDDCLLTC